METFFYVLGIEAMHQIYDKGISYDVNDSVEQWTQHVTKIAKRGEACNFASKNDHSIIVDGEGKIQWHWYKGKGNWKPKGDRNSKTMYNPMLQCLQRYQKWLT